MGWREPASTWGRTQAGQPGLPPWIVDGGPVGQGGRRQAGVVQPDGGKAGVGGRLGRGGRREGCSLGWGGLFVTFAMGVFLYVLPVEGRKL